VFKYGYLRHIDVIFVDFFDVVGHLLRWFFGICAIMVVNEGYFAVCSRRPNTTLYEVMIITSMQ
jgi:hypothetical protein